MAPSRPFSGRRSSRTVARAGSRTPHAVPLFEHRSGRPSRLGGGWLRQTQRVGYRSTCWRIGFEEMSGETSTTRALRMYAQVTVFTCGDESKSGKYTGEEATNKRGYPNLTSTKIPKRQIPNTQLAVAEVLRATSDGKLLETHQESRAVPPGGSGSSLALGKKFAQTVRQINFTKASPGARPLIQLPSLSLEVSPHFHSTSHERPQAVKMHPVPNNQRDHYHPSTYGFVGLGNMGYGMAMNLRRKIPLDSNLVICELVHERCESFIAANKGSGISVATTPRDVAQQAVR